MLFPYEVKSLLSKLCVKLGFCLPPQEAARLRRQCPFDIDSFTNAVFVAEGLPPDMADRHLYRSVRDLVTQAFRAHEQNEQFSSVRTRVLKYLLVLQFQGDSLADFDLMVALEDQLTRDLGRSANVDGHDCGSNEVNIFIFTSDPETTFWRVRHTLEQKGYLREVMAAYREIEGNDYNVIWPEGSHRPFKVA